MISFLLGVGITSFVLFIKNRDKLYFYPDNYYQKTKNKIINIKNSYAITNLKNKPNKRCLLISHGNSGNITQYDKIISDLEKQYDGDIYCFEYPGFGFYKGIANINNSVNENLKWLNILNNEYREIDLWGFSIGGGIMIETLTKISKLPNYQEINDKINNIYIHGSFSNIKNVIYHRNTQLGDFYSLLKFNDLHTKQNLKHSVLKNKKIIILHSKDDKIVPYQESIINYNTAKKLKLNTRFIEIKGNHNNYIFPDNIFKS
jgi:alpha-beta hydrolase superfamily lysophospholipase